MRITKSKNNNDTDDNCHRCMSIAFIIIKHLITQKLIN